MPEKRRALAAISAFGLLGVSFASVLVIGNLKAFDEHAGTAASCFAVCIPLGVGGYVLYEFASGLPFPKAVQSYVKWACLAVMAIAQFGCAIGLYWFFRHISDHAGQLFLWTALACYVVAGLIMVAGVLTHLSRPHVEPKADAEKQGPVIEDNSRSQEPRIES